MTQEDLDTIQEIQKGIERLEIELQSTTRTRNQLRNRLTLLVEEIDLFSTNELNEEKIDKLKPQRDHLAIGLSKLDLYKKRIEHNIRIRENQLRNIQSQSNQ